MAAIIAAHQTDKTTQLITKISNMAIPYFCDAFLRICAHCIKIPFLKSSDFLGASALCCGSDVRFVCRHPPDAQQILHN